MSSKVSLRVSAYLWMNPQRCDELLALLQDYGGTIDEVAFFTSFTHPPLPLAVVEERARTLGEVLPRFKALGLSAGINHLSTLGHHEENLENSLNEPWQRMMDIDGNITRGCYCPVDPQMREHIAASYVALAKAAPDFLWIDDDVRLEGHGPIQHACFCDTCLARFSEETGRPWTRESLKEAFSGGSIEDPIALRKGWLEHNRQLLSELLSHIRVAVDTVNSNLTLGLMAGEIFYAGYGYAQWARSLAGEKDIKVMWRPGGGFYTDTAPAGMLEKAHTIGRQIAQLPSGVVDVQSEIENFPYQPLKKSVAITALEVAVHIAAGCTGAALNVFGISQDPFAEYLPYFDKVRRFRNFYEKEVETFGRSRCEGIGLGIHRDYYASLNPFGNWFDAPSWAGAGVIVELAELGLPMAYSMDDASVTVLTGSSCLAFSKEELLKVLSGGVLADAAALHFLNEMGLSGYTGFEVAGEREDDTLEVFTDDPINGEFAGWHRDCRQSFKGWAEVACGIRPLSRNSRVLSEGRDFAGRKLFPLGGVFENSLGGRFAVCGYFPWRYVQSFAKASQLKSLCRWLSRDTLPAYVASFHKVALWCRRDKDGNPALLLLNSSLDSADTVRLALLGETGRLTATRMDCSAGSVTCLGQDQGYSVFQIGQLSAWEAVLVTHG